MAASNKPNGIGQMLIDGESYHGDEHLNFTADSIQQIIANFEARSGAELPIRHGSHDTTLAAGWITGLTSVVDGDHVRLFATVKWTDDAAADIKGDKLRYISPEIVLNYPSKTDGNSQGMTLVGAALLNDPHIEDQPPVIAFAEAVDIGEVICLQAVAASVAASDELSEGDKLSQEDQQMREQLITILGLAPEATDDEILTAIKSLANPEQPPEQAEQAAATAAKLAEAQADIVKLSAVAETSSADVIRLTAEVEKLNAEKQATTAAAAVDKLISEGRATPAQREDMVSIYLANSELAESLFNKMQTIVELNTSRGASDHAGPMDDETRQLAAYKTARDAGKTPLEAFDAAKISIKSNK